MGISKHNGQYHDSKCSERSNNSYLNEQDNKYFIESSRFLLQWYY